MQQQRNRDVATQLNANLLGNNTDPSTFVSDGQATRWTGIVENELATARQVQTESVGLKLREIEQAVMATFLHSQPTGRSAKTRELLLLIGPCWPDKIELKKGLVRWSNNRLVAG